MFTIRDATSTDAHALRDLYANHLAPPSAEEANKTLADWENMLGEITADRNCHLLVGVTNDGEIVSSVSLIVIKNLTHGLRPYAVIENVVTHANHRNRGYASSLMAAAKDTAVESGCYKIMLMTGSKKESTLRFYKKCGFTDDKTAFQIRL